LDPLAWRLLLEVLSLALKLQTDLKLAVLNQFAVSIMEATNSNLFFRTTSEFKPVSHTRLNEVIHLWVIRGAIELDLITSQKVEARIRARAEAVPQHGLPLECHQFNVYSEVRVSVSQVLLVTRDLSAIIREGHWTGESGTPSLRGRGL